MANDSVHTPVLLKEVLDVLGLQPGHVVVDATLGGGGHAKEMLKAIGPKGFLLGIDADLNAVNRYNKSAKAKNTKAVQGNFAQIEELAKANGFEKVDAILFDFGISSDQLDDPERGFSFQRNGGLDMRLDQSDERRTAADYVNSASPDDLAEIIKEYGEEINAKRIARAIAVARKNQPIETTEQLFEIIKRTLPAKLRFKAGDVARRTFQALRIKVNNELEVIAQGLQGGYNLLNQDGRLAAISFHSLEDRIVKKFFAQLSQNCVCPPEFPVCVCGNKAKAAIITPKPIAPTESEQDSNPRSKSAKLRAIKRL